MVVEDAGLRRLLLHLMLGIGEPLWGLEDRLLPGQLARRNYHVGVLVDWLTVLLGDALVARVWTLARVR